MAEASARMRDAGVPHPRRDALLLLSDALGRDKAWVLAHPDASVPEGSRGLLAGSLGRRLRREPLQYIRGFHEFWGLRIRVGPGCLVPRPETEHLVEEAVGLLRGIRRPRVAEVGCGSGCVLLALAGERSDALLAGLDLSREALAWSRRNCGGTPRILLLRGDLGAGSPLKGLDLLVSNPPYIADWEWDSLPPEVRDFEPEGALRCGAEPLGPYRALAEWAVRCVRPGGHLAAEVGVAQARRASALRRLHPRLAWVRSVPDYSGRLRVVVWRVGARGI